MDTFSDDLLSIILNKLGYKSLILSRVSRFFYALLNRIDERLLKEWYFRGEILPLARRNFIEGDQNILFEEKRHIYTVIWWDSALRVKRSGKSIKRFVSVTTWIHTLFEKFNANKVIKKYEFQPKEHISMFDLEEEILEKEILEEVPEVEKIVVNNNKYRGQTAREIKKRWKRDGEEASQLGTELHQSIESFYNGTLPSDRDFCLFHKFQYESPNEPFRTEMRIFDKELKLCGSVDMLYRCECNCPLPLNERERCLTPLKGCKSPLPLNERERCLTPLKGCKSPLPLNERERCQKTHVKMYDWKRIKKCNREGFNGKCGIKKITKNIQDCNYEHYRIQLHIYKLILERNYPIIVDSMAIVLLHPSQDEPITINYDFDTKLINNIIKYRTNQVKER